jgi:hypothetical protein
MRARKRAQRGRRQRPGIAAEHIDAPLARAQGGADQTQKRRLAGSRRTDDGQLFAGLHRQGDVAQRDKAVAVRQLDVMQTKQAAYFSRPAAFAACSIPA